MGEQDWKAGRSRLISVLEHGVRRRCYSMKKRKILEGVLAFCKGDERAQSEYEQAVKDGAMEILFPWEKWRTGFVDIPCCGTADGDCGQYPLPDRIELEIFDWLVWPCPRCGMVWALRTEVPEEDEDDTA